MTKKVLFFCPDFYPRNTGYANAFLNLIKALINYENYQIDVLTDVSLEDRVELNIKGLNIIRVSKRNSIKLLRFVINQRFIAREIQSLDYENKYDVILMETLEYALVPYFLGKQILKKFSVRIHACYETERRFFYPGFLHAINRYIVTSLVSKKLENYLSTNQYHIDFSKKHFLNENLYSICAKRFFVVPNTIDMDNSTKSIQPQGKLKFLTLGRMDHSGRLQKGFSDLFTALALCSPEVKESIEYTIIGKGEYLPKYKQFIFENNLNFVETIDYETHDVLLNRLMECDVVVLPSRYEGMSMFALEALATSNAVIFSNTGGLVDMLDDGVNGYAFNPQDIEGLVEALESMIVNKKNILNMKNASKELYQKKFSPKAVARKFDLFTQIIASQI